MLQMLPSIEDGHVVLHFGGEIDEQSAATVAQMIDRSKGDCSLDFTDVKRVEAKGFSLLAEAIKRCPYRLAVRGLKGASPLEYRKSTNDFTASSRPPSFGLVLSTR